MGIAHKLRQVYDPATDPVTIQVLANISGNNSNGYTEHSVLADEWSAWGAKNPFASQRLEYLVSQGFDVIRIWNHIAISWKNASENPDHKGILTLS